MLFNSFEFAIFLPIVFTLYWLLNKNLKWQNLLVVVASYFFYGWWDWRFLILIAFTSLCSYCSGRWIAQVRDGDRNDVQTKHKTKIITAINIVINLLVLCIFKYYNFFVESLTLLFPALHGERLLLNIILPVGISFYTFQALSYSIDVYRQKINPTKNIVAFLAYVSFFPQLVAGPIERATNLLPQFERKRTFEYETGVDGLRQILWGLFKKVLVADRCAVYVDMVWTDYANQSGSSLALAAILFAFQIYGDFSGYSDIAIGTAKLFGIKLMRNFNIPYFSRDIAEFWRRWHISLTTWFRDYLYIPIGGSRVSKVKVIRNTFVIFLVSGLWHGANWTFVAWGAYHAVLFLPLILLGKNRKYTDIVASEHFLPNIKEALQMLITFLLAVIGWIIFRANCIGDAWLFFSNIFQQNFFSIPDVIPYVTGFFILIMLSIEWINRRRNHGFDIVWIKQGWIRVIIYYMVIFCILYFSFESEAFIYFQF